MPGLIGNAQVETSASSSTLQKRNLPANSEEQGRSSKKLCRAPSLPFPVTTLLKVVNLPLTYHPLVSRNVVFLHKQDFSLLFGDSSGRRDSSFEAFVTIANNIYQAVIGFSHPGAIGLNRCQIQGIRDYFVNDAEGRDIVSVMSAGDLQRKSFPIKQLLFTLYPRGEGGTARDISVNELRSYFLENYQRQRFRNEQELPFILYGVEYRVKLSAIQFEEIESKTKIEKQGFSSPFPQDYRYGFITERTHIDFVSRNTKLTLLDRVIDSGIKEIEVFADLITIPQLSAEERDQLPSSSSLLSTSLAFSENQDVNLNSLWSIFDWREGRPPLPLLLNHEQLQSAIQKILFDRRFYREENVYLNLGYGVVLRASINKIDHTRSASDNISNQSHISYKKSFVIGRNSSSLMPKVMIRNNRDEIILVKSAREGVVAQVLHFEVEGVNQKHGYLSAAYMSYEELREALLNSRVQLATGGRIVLDLQTCQVLLRLKSGENDKIFMENLDLPRVQWRKNKDTRLDFRIPSRISTPMVQNKKPISLKKVVVEVELVKPRKKYSMMTPPADWDSIFVTEKELMVLFKEAVDQFLITGKKFEIFPKSGNGLQITIKTFEDPDNPENIPKTKLEVLGKLSSETEIIFKTGKNKKVMIGKPIVIADPKTLQERLLTLGLGGLKKQVEDIYNLFAAYYGPYQTLFTESGLGRPRGLLLYGQPGTGKTSLAKVLGKLLEVPPERIIHRSGTDVKNAYVGRTEENIRQLFEPARKAEEECKKVREKAPLFLIILEEIDAIAPSRSRGYQQHVNSFVNQLLHSLDGPDTPQNVLFVGTTNRKENLDEALLRPKRLGVHKRIGLPDRKSRAEIIDIYLKKLRETDSLMENITTAWLVSITKNFSGAEIEGMIIRANVDAVARINRSDISVTEARSHALRKVTREDFEKAARTFKREASLAERSMYL